jgi:hypothetical protein
LFRSRQYHPRRGANHSTFAAASQRSLPESFAQPDDCRHRDCQGERRDEKHRSGF